MIFDGDDDDDDDDDDVFLDGGKGDSLLCSCFRRAVDLP